MFCFFSRLYWFSQPEEPIQVMMDRSVSLCRLHLRDGDSDHGRNRAPGSRVKERSSRFQRDCGQALPTVPISSGGGGGPRPARPAASRSWSTEDFRIDRSPEEAVSTEATLEVTQTSGSPLPTDTPSPAESVAPDSAIGSPDGWVDSDSSAAPEKFPESQSESSLCDSGTAWELHRAMPVQIAAPNGEQSCADEGIYSLESVQERGPSPTNDPEPVSPKGCHTLNPGQDIPPDQLGAGGVQAEAGHQQREQENLHQSPEQDNLLADDDASQPIMVHCGGLPPPCYSSSEKQPWDDAAEQSGDTRNHHQETTTSTTSAENQTKAEDAESGVKQARGQAHPEETTEMCRDEGHLRTQNGKSEEPLRECPDPQELVHQVQVSEEGLTPKGSTVIPLITVSSEAEKACEDPASLLELQRSEAAVGDTNPESSRAPEEPVGCPWETPSPATEEVQPRVAGADPERGLSDENDLRRSPPFPTDRRELTQGCEHPQLHRFDSSGTSQLGSGFTVEDRPDCATTEQDRGQEIHLFSSGLPGRFLSIDLLQAGWEETFPTDDPVGDPLEPMDLFYPDKDEPVFNEPPETETEAWHSVLSVSALQPAPASQLFEDPLPELLGHHLPSENSQVGVSPAFIISVKQRLQKDAQLKPNTHYPILANPRVN